MQDLKEFYYTHFNPNPEPYIIPGDYLYKIPVLTDMHLVCKEPSNRTKYFPKQMSILYNIEDFLIANMIEILIDAGDLTDRGEETVKTLLQNHIEHGIRRIFYGRNSFAVVGNHEITYSKNNLFYAHANITSKTQQQRFLKEQLILPTEPLFKVVDKISVMGIDIHFMHFDPKKRYYIPPSDRFTIAIFHEDIITLESKEKLYHHKHGMGIDIENTNIMENVDIAICAHIHKPMQPFRLNNLKKTLVIVPGSLCQRTREENHTMVNIPVICITKEGKVEIQYAPFHLGDIAETINVQKDAKLTKQRQLQKEVKKYKERANLARTFEEFLDTLTPEERFIVDQADNEIMPIAVAKYLSNNY